MNVCEQNSLWTIKAEKGSKDSDKIDNEEQSLG